MTNMAKRVLKAELKARLDEAFWTKFSRSFWERKSFALQNVDSPLLNMDAREIFNLLVRYANKCRREKDSNGFKFYIHGDRIHESQVLEVLPIARDGSLEGYHQRMERLFEDYCLVCDELLQVNQEKQHLLAEFTSKLYEHVGFPNRFAEMGLYLGNYRKTPFGIHVDGCGVFSFPIAGKKTFRIWPKEPASKRSKKGSFVLSARPGDMTYWPSTAWHIAESDGRFSATWSLGVWVDQPFKTDLSKIISELVSSRLGERARNGMTPFKSLKSDAGQVTALPDLYSEAIARLRDLSATELNETFLKRWMTHISKQGFKVVPNKESALKTGAFVRLRERHSPILWMHAKESQQLFLSFNGVQTEARFSQGLLKLVKSINAGQPVKVTRRFPQSLRAFALAGAYTFE
jgi:hypothetical protein